jgi:hypothetical protein
MMYLRRKWDALDDDQQEVFIMAGVVVAGSVAGIVGTLIICNLMEVIHALV